MATTDWGLELAAFITVLVVGLIVVIIRAKLGKEAANGLSPKHKFYRQFAMEYPVSFAAFMALPIIVGLAIAEDLMRVMDTGPTYSYIRKYLVGLALAIAFYCGEKYFRKKEPYDT